MTIQRLTPSQYPFLLRQIEKQPKFLNLIGQLPLDSYKFLCVIGSRTHSSYGLNACKKIISGLRGYPIVIVSGMAIGIDSIAHETALEVGLKTIAVPGSGLDDEVLYPPSKKPLAKKIVDAGGALLSPFENNCSVAKWTFPIRNQIMAALSNAVLVIEARKKSGTIITADAAGNCGRNMLAVPGSIFSNLSQGANRLIREGATAITSSSDVLEALGFELPESYGIHSKDVFLHDSSLSVNERRILEYLETPRMRDDLMRELKMSASELNSVLVELELKDIIFEEDGYILCQY